MTEADGNFTFMVEPGLYTLIQENLDGFSDVTDSDGDDPNVIEIDVELSDDLENVFIDEMDSTAPSGEPTTSPTTAPTGVPTEA
eukprot:CAMPEP_0194058590 /NCGR_PEP_ID=MMETSP0009_2-20130614/66682_1 /TAXON_ID=210454 /ORGANISM="Grammatophora oceanica, Strain CCMP 410" /LENGTH=83 /DNA_ID=CAMNT_0038708797 /DNA_START=69 /DNA_END=316 /DNA_ORIENTATION=-